jgi:YVTN family beta-propeller protein
MTIRSAARHRKSRPVSPTAVGFRRWAGMLGPVLAVVAVATAVGGVSSAVAADNPNPTVIVGGDPQGVAVDPDGKHAYVASFADNAVRVIDTASQKLVGWFRVGAYRGGLGVDPDSRHAFVTNYSENSVSVIDTANGRLIKNVPVGVNPGSVTVFPRDHYVFVTNYYGNTLSVINSRDLKLVGTVPVGARPDGVAVDPRGEFAYVANSGGNTVTVIDVHTQKVVRSIVVGRAPQKVAIDPDGRHAYVTNYGDNTVSVIELPTQLGMDLYNAVLSVNTIAVGINPRGLAVTPDSHHALVVNVGEDTMTVIDTATAAVISTAFVGYSPDEVAVAPNNTAYVTARGDGTVTVVRPS